MGATYTDGTERIGPHDLGGLSAEAIDRREHNLTYWERQVDATVILLLRKGIITKFAQVRRGIESLGPDAYEEARVNSGVLNRRADVRCPLV